MHYVIKRKRRNDFGVKGMKKGVRKAINNVSNSAVGRAAKTIGKNYKKAFTNNVGLAKRLLKQKNIGHKLTGAYVAATTPFATAVGGTALNLKSGYKGAKKMITGKDSAIRKKCTYKDYGVKGMKKGVRKAIKDSLIIMAYRKRQLRDAKVAYLKAKKRCLARRDSNLRRYSDGDIKSLLQKLKDQFMKIKDGLKQFTKDHPTLNRLLKVLSSLVVMLGTEQIAGGQIWVKDYNKYQKMNQDLKSGIIELERENDGSFGMSKIPNKYMLGLKFCIALVGKIIGIALLVSAAKPNKNSAARRKKNSDSSYHYDSRAKLIIAKHRYQDALRRYQDSVLDTLKQKFKSVLEKIKKTVKEYIKAFPFLSSLTAGLMSMSSVGDAYGIVAGAPKILSTLEYQSKLIDQQDFSAYGKAGLKTRNVLLALYVVAKQIIKSIIKLKIAKGISETLKEK